jgi:dienelactone hydrolase
MDSKRNLARDLLVSVALLLSPLALAQSVADPALSPALERDLWRRETSRYVRTWTFVPASDTTDPTASNLPAGNPNQSWGNEIDVYGAAGLSFVDRASGTPHTVIARTSVTRAAAGPATLRLGVAGQVDVWVNGQKVFQRPAAPYLLDGERIPVELHSGDNEIALRLTQRGPDWLLSLRVAEAGTQVLPPAYAPFIVPSPERELVVDSTSQGRTAPEKIRFRVVSADGAERANAETTVGRAVHFNTHDWPDGPYEIRGEHADRGGVFRTTYLPWYKGDAHQLTRQLFAAAAKANETPRGGHLRLLAELARARGGETWAGDPALLATLLHPVLMEFRELEYAGAQTPVAGRPSGFVRLAYGDEVDGSTQFARAYLPAHYAAGTRWPLLVVLHGFNPPNPPLSEWWSVDRRHDAIADELPVVVLEVHGRGNAQYQGPGERDVLRAMDDAKRAFSIDDNRVYLLGESMGGHGTWRIASRHPSLFAAAAPYFGGWDLRLQPAAAGGFASAAPRNRWEAFAYESGSSFGSAENLLNVPLYVSHGDADRVVSVEYSRHAVRLLERWGYDVRSSEPPGYGHEDLDTRSEVVRWLLTHRRPEAPPRVRVRSPDLAAAESAWLRVTAAARAGEMIQADAEFVTADQLRLDTENAAALELRLPSSLRTSPLRIVWNGEVVSPRIVEGTLILEARGFKPSGTRKTAGLEGPISDLIAHPFLIVVGTRSADPEMREVCRIKADAFAGAWRRWQHTSPRVKTDTEVTTEDRRRFSLLLIGSAEANAITHELQDRLPLRVTEDGFALTNRRWSVRDGLGVAISPNPEAVGEYVLLVSAASAKGLSLWQPTLWAEPFGFSSVVCDWYIRDARRVALPPGRFAPTSFVAYGLFDPTWQRTDELTFEGDAEARQNGSPRGDALRGEAARAELETFEGTYELFPGVNFRVQRRDESIWITPPGQPELRLSREGALEFGARENGAQVRFEKSGDRVERAVINSEGSELVLRRLL